MPLNWLNSNSNSDASSKAKPSPQALRASTGMLAPPRPPALKAWSRNLRGTPTNTTREAAATAQQTQGQQTHTGSASDQKGREKVGEAEGSGETAIAVKESDHESDEHAPCSQQKHKPKNSSGMATARATAAEGETPVKRAKRVQAGIGQYFYVKHGAGPQRRLVTSPASSPSQQPAFLPSEASTQRKQAAQESCTKLKTHTLKSRQMYLDLGQPSTRKECKLCGMVYFAGEETDVKAHQSFHDVFQKGVKFQLKAGEKDVIWHSSRTPQSCIMRVRHATLLASKKRKTRPRLQEKIEEVHAFMDRFLGDRHDGSGKGASDAPRLSDNGTTYVWIQERRVIGCVEAEHIEWGMRVMPSADATPQCGRDSENSTQSQQRASQCGGSGGLETHNNTLAPGASQQASEAPIVKSAKEHQDKRKSANESSDSGVCLPHDVLMCSQERVRACVGVRKMWVHPSHRHRGIAHGLVDAARAHTIFNYAADAGEVAFSSPTADGQRFAAKYCHREDFLVYELS